jgi:multisubunit Na+/H+ antiporter MnhG subunit
MSLDPLLCRSRACHYSTSRACGEPSQVAAVVGEEEQAFSEFLPVVGFLQCFPGLVAYSPGWSGTRIWLPLYCNTSTTRGLVCLTKKERIFFSRFCVFLSAFGIWQVKSYFKRLPTHELGEGALFEAHLCAQRVIIMFLGLFVLLCFSFSSFLPFFFLCLCSNFFGHLLH